MPNSLLGAHLIDSFGLDDRALQHIARMQYRSLKVFEDVWANKDKANKILGVLPRDAIIVARDHPLSEQHADMWRDPVGTGNRHADEWKQKVDQGRYHFPLDRTKFIGINEPDATAGDRKAIDRYSAAFLRRLKIHGFGGGALNLSTGHPRTADGTGKTPPDYSIFSETHKAITEGNHIAIAHIYGVANQPCVPGHYDRLKYCLWGSSVRWLIGECGIDQHVTGAAHQGYATALPNRALYPKWLDELILGSLTPYIHSYEVFTFGGYSPWETFDIRHVYDALEQYQWKHIELVPDAPKPPVVVIPPGLPVSQPVPPSGMTWDKRLTQRGVKFIPCAADKLPAGTVYYRLVQAYFLDKEQAQGKVSIGVDVWDEKGKRIVGQPVRMYWQNGEVGKPTEAKPNDKWAVDFPMYASGNAYGIQVNGAVSDQVTGMGLGDIENPNMGIHVCYYLVFQKQIAQAKPVDPPTPQPEPPIPTPTPKTATLPIVAGAFSISQRWDTDPDEKHEGIDLAAGAGTPVLAIADGTVMYVGDHRSEMPPPPGGGYGLYARLEHHALGMHSFYAHLSLQQVVVGQQVRQGQQIGKVGSTGNSSGNHLHFETRLVDAEGQYIAATPFANGRVDPESELARYGVSFTGGGSKTFLPVVAT